MKATILQENLASALGVVSRSVSSKAQVAVLANVLIKEENGGMSLLGTNLESGVKVNIPGNVEKGFGITVPARQLHEFISGIGGGQIELSVSETKLKVLGGKFEAEIAGISDSEFPVFPQPSGEAISLPSDELKSGLFRCAFAAANDESRPVLAGVLWEGNSSGLTLVATDGYRLSKVEITVKDRKGTLDGVKMLVPVRAVNEMARLVEEQKAKEIKLWVTEKENQVIFKVGEVELISRLIEGNFPDYKKIIPGAGTTKIKADKKELMRAVKLSAIFARESANVVKIQISSTGNSGGKLVISATSSQLGENKGEVEIEKEGEDLEVVFNFRYLSEFLGNIEGDLVEFESGGPLAPGVFKTKEEPEFLHIIMPVRV